jgi:hypothetical protein
MLLLSGRTPLYENHSDEVNSLVHVLTASAPTNHSQGVNVVILLFTRNEAKGNTANIEIPSQKITGPYASSLALRSLRDSIPEN